MCYYLNVHFQDRSVNQPGSRNTKNFALLQATGVAKMYDDILVKFRNYYDVNNQQDATTFSFINLFKSAQHVSGDKFAHPQEQSMEFHLNRDTGRQQRRCIVPKAIYTVKKCS